MQTLYYYATADPSVTLILSTVETVEPTNLV